MSQTTSAVRNAAGRAIRLTGVITDVTARKAAEQAAVRRY
jgi:hypothetical protein